MVIAQRYLAICFILFSVLVSDCNKDKKTNCDNSFCSQEYRYITILIRHSSDSSAFVLTDFKVLRVSDNKNITINNNILNQNPGYYPLVSDDEIVMLRNTNVEIEFQGYVDNALIIGKRFVVTADCCHVILVSGESMFYI